MDSRISGGTATGFGAIGLFMVSISVNFVEPFRTICADSGPLLTAFFLWFWPHFMMRVDARAAKRSIRMIEKLLKEYELSPEMHERFSKDLDKLKAAEVNRRIKQVASRNASSFTEPSAERRRGS